MVDKCSLCNGSRDLSNHILLQWPEIWGFFYIVGLQGVVWFLLWSIKMSLFRLVIFYFYFCKIVLVSYLQSSDSYVVFRSSYSSGGNGNCFVKVVE